jgi:hypothetical protein
MSQTIARVVTSLLGSFAFAAAAMLAEAGTLNAQPAASDLREKVAKLERLLRELEERIRDMDRVFLERIEALEQDNKRLRLELDVHTTGHALGKLKRGMSRKEVERILGRPARLQDDEDMTEKGNIPTQVGTYYLRLPKHPGEQLMTIHYRKVKGAWVFHEWRGPHVPD